MAPPATRRSTAPEEYRGHADMVEPVLSGWLVDPAQPGSPVAFVLKIDAEPGIADIADRPRLDVSAAGFGGPDCGFAVELPVHLLDGAEHALALSLPDGRELNLPGLPARRALGPVRADLILARNASLDEVLGLLRRNDAEAGFDPRLVGPGNAAAFNAMRSVEQGFVFYARAGDRLVGYARLDRGPGAAAAVGVVGLTVLEAYRRKGLGELLMRALLQAAGREQSLRRLWLSVRPENLPAIRLYEKHGFTPDPNHPPGGWAVPGEMTMAWSPA